LMLFNVSALVERGKKGFMQTLTTVFLCPLFPFSFWSLHQSCRWKHLASWSSFQGSIRVSGERGGRGKAGYSGDSLLIPK
jgi:hypothetical protein